MKYKLASLLASTLILTNSVFADTTINFNSEVHAFTQDEKQLITNIVNRTEQSVRDLLPSLTEEITFNIVTTNRNLDIVGGATGRADAPGVIELTLSTASKDGISGAANSALTSSVYHELHHLVRGWTITQNKYGAQHGIPVAVVNEGLASIFAETYTDEYFAAAYDYPEQAAVWLDEIMQLPLDANYNHWVSGFHPDGRTVIGYRIGRYVVHEAMRKTGKDILELSEMTPSAILAVVLDRSE